MRGHDPRQKKNRSEPAFGPAFLLERFLVSKAAALRAWKPRNWVGVGGETAESGSQKSLRHARWKFKWCHGLTKLGGGNRSQQRGEALDKGMGCGIDHDRDTARK